MGGESSADMWVFSVWAREERWIIWAEGALGALCRAEQRACTGSKEGTITTTRNHTTSPPVPLPVHGKPASTVTLGLAVPLFLLHHDCPTIFPQTSHYSYVHLLWCFSADSDPKTCFFSIRPSLSLGTHRSSRTHRSHQSHDGHAREALAVKLLAHS